MATHIAAIDQGTTSTRCLIFAADGRVVALAQREHRQIYPEPGWVEHDPVEIWHNTRGVLAEAMARAGITVRDLAGLGITNQRETAVLWDRATGAPLHPAIVWQDTRVDGLVAAFAREGGQDRYRARTGLPLASYFSGLKLKWLLDHLPGVRDRAAAGEVLFGTIDSWLVWNLTGGPAGGLHVSDVTNASRTQLMRLDRFAWDPEILADFAIPAGCLPRIVSSSEVIGAAVGDLAGVPIAGILGDQQAALVGQGCFRPGEAKNTYGTGCFLLMNTGGMPVPSHAGLITTVAYRFGTEPACYALEGSVAIAGALVQWLRDNLGLIGSSAEIEALAAAVPDNGDVYIVPAFSGLYAPYWRADARGVITGLTRFADRRHLARAALEATAYQTLDVITAMTRDSGIAIETLKVDGGMVANDLLMQFQADILGVPVTRPAMAETTALGAAYAAGRAVGLWQSPADLVAVSGGDRIWEPAMDAGRRETLVRAWHKAVTRSFDWVAG